MQRLLLLFFVCACLVAQPLKEKVTLGRLFSGDKESPAQTHKFFFAFTGEFSKAFFAEGAPSDIKPGWELTFAYRCAASGHDEDAMILGIAHKDYQGSVLQIKIPKGYGDKDLADMAKAMATGIWKQILLLQEHPKKPPPRV